VTILEQYLADRAAILELLARYNSAFDEADHEGWAACFAEDGVLESPFSGDTTGRAEFMAMSTAMAGTDQVGNVVTTDHLVSISGDTASETCTAVIFGGPNVQTVGRYDDELVRTAEGWKFQRRRFSTLGVQPPPVIGAPDPLVSSLLAEVVDPRLRDLADRIAIAELSARYNRAFDDDDGAAWADTFTDDGVLIGASGTSTGRNELIQRCHDNPNVAHMTTDFVIELGGDRARQYVTGMIFRSPVGTPVAYARTGWYTDDLVRGPDGWRFTSRSVVTSN
jgi:ketosteroid isomerase-like protein